MSSLLKTFAVALVLKARSWQKHVAFLLNYVRVLFRRSLKTFHLVFTLAVRPDIPTLLTFSDSCLMVDSFVFSLALHRCPLRSLVQRSVFTTYVSIFSSGSFLVNIALLSNSITWCPYRCISGICFSPSLLAPFCLGLVRDFGGGRGGESRLRSTLRGYCLPWAFGTRLLPRVLWQSTSGSPPT